MNLSQLNAKMAAAYQQSEAPALSLRQSAAVTPSPTPPHRLTLPRRTVKKSLSTSSPKSEGPTWNPVQKAASAVLDAMERLLISPMEAQRPLPSTIDPATQLAGNFCPVAEETPASLLLHVEGAVPAGLGPGTYVRNGANPHLSPAGGHHLFDGDGMLHAVTFAADGAVTYAARFTRTYRLEHESSLGRPFFPKAIGELHGHTGLARLLLYYARGQFGLVDLNQGMGVANAGVVFFDGKLLAMSEDDLPYAVDVTAAGDLKTIGRYDFNGQLSSSTTSMIAHPKIDPATGELLALSYDVVKKPYLKYFRFSADGERLGPEVAIALDRPVMVHDFAITEKFVVVPDQQVVFDLKKIFDGYSPVYHDADKPCRFGLLPREAENDSNLQWIEVPDCFCFHLWNAWEDGDDVVIIASCMTPADSIFNDRPEALTSVLSEIRLHRISGTSTVRPIAPGVNLEMGTVNKHYVGKKSKYTYMAVAEPWPKVSGIAKVDVSSENTESAIVGKYMYPEGCYGGEPLFVPRATTTKNDNSDNDDTAEDDGYILSFIHNEITDKSSLLILDAASPSLQTLASIELPSRVPFGFHGTFIQH